MRSSRRPHLTACYGLIFTWIPWFNINRQVPHATAFSRTPLSFTRKHRRDIDSKATNSKSSESIRFVNEVLPSGYKRDVCELGPAELFKRGGVCGGAGGGRGASAAAPKQLDEFTGLLL
ncbi:hypothetical protein EVAR_68281_1 [Eumeta japonica]|uniref:Uncharacterized protein n=1 Tax=Eumeta variegata TaxID=151549 RepID=A0A4C1ZYF4_EUMVA|nr:hypothetical protein EVAR_68281_1 [Eumeta japonica]